MVFHVLSFLTVFSFIVTGGSGGKGNRASSYLGCLGLSSSNIDSKWKFRGKKPSCSYTHHAGKGKGNSGGSSSSGGGSGGSGSSGSGSGTCGKRSESNLRENKT